MDVLEAIHTRRSIRKYVDQPVPEELVQKLLAAAMQAPSARNQQPWEFVVIDDRAPVVQDPGVHAQRGNGRRGPAGNPRLRGPGPGDIARLLDGGLCRGRRRTCSWRRMAWAWARCGVASIPETSGWTGLRQLAGLPKNVVAHSLVVRGLRGREGPRGRSLSARTRATEPLVTEQPMTRRVI